MIIGGCETKENICDSSNPLCKYFEIYYPEDSIIGEDVAELAEEDLETYRKISEDFLSNTTKDSIFHVYSNGIFIPRFSYSLLNEVAEEELYLAVALYPVDKKNKLKDTLEIFYKDPDIKYASESIYGECNFDNGSYLSGEYSKLYNCLKDNIFSYDYWIEDEDYMWRLKCVWRNNKFSSVRDLKITNYSSSDLCRKSFESFKLKTN
jgi:hypothetical protein|tara:strand:- start:83 stop:703 length:621 start_codon:yes stop_codon:yes gene_type:complete